MNELLLSQIWNPVFEGDDENPAVVSAQATYDAIEDKDSDSAKSAALVLEAVKKGTSKSLFTQDDVNGFLAKDKKKLQGDHQKTLDELNILKKRANLSAEERAELEKRIEDTQLAITSKEEMAHQDKKKLEKAHAKEIGSLTTDRDNWHSLYKTSTIDTAITNAAVNHKAFAPSQIISFLGPKTQIIEGLDAKGKPNGTWVPEVTFNDFKDDKPIVLKLSPMDAVKRMKEMEEHVNLFKGEGDGGLGRFQRQQGKEPDAKDIAKDPAAYRKARKEGTLDYGKSFNS
jgi:hypothetical protein